MRLLIVGHGEWKAGQGRVTNLRQTAPAAAAAAKTPAPALSPEEEQLANAVRDVDHESVRNPVTGEWGGFAVGREPVRVSNGTGETCWSVKGRCSDF